nr:YcaO-like family protein [Mycobacterium innocens]
MACRERHRRHEVYLHRRSRLGADLDPGSLSRPPGSFYHRGARLDWMAATTLLTGRRRWVPWSVVAVDISVNDRWGPPMFTMHTQGLASGNSDYEAALHGLYEIMERHAVGTAVAGSTMWAVRSQDLDGADCAGLVDQVHRAGRQVRIARLDVWQDHYCFAAGLISISPTSSVQFAGSGLHQDPNVAFVAGDHQGRSIPAHRNPRYS